MGLAAGSVRGHEALLCASWWNYAASRTRSNADPLLTAGKGRFMLGVHRISVFLAVDDCHNSPKIPHSLASGPSNPDFTVVLNYLTLLMSLMIS